LPYVAPKPYLGSKGIRSISKAKRARAALESSSKRGSPERISNRQEFWNKEIGHLTYNDGNRALEVLRGRKYF